jgi:hypothetical protein
VVPSTGQQEMRPVQSNRWLGAMGAMVFGFAVEKYNSR